MSMTKTTAATMMARSRAKAMTLMLLMPTLYPAGGAGVLARRGGGGWGVPSFDRKLTNEIKCP